MKKTVLVLNKTKFQKEKEERESRARKQDAEAAAVFETFAASFAPEQRRHEEGGAAAGLTFVRGGVIQKGELPGGGGASLAAAVAAVGTEYRMQAPLPAPDGGVAAAAAAAGTLGSPAAAAPRKPREMDLLMEEMMRRNSKPEGRGGGGGDPAPGDASHHGGARGGAPRSFSGPGSGDPLTTNLLLSNLSPTATEEELMERFRRHGGIASVKVMWPRSDEERARGRNTGFVMFYERADAEAAMGALQDTEIEGQRIFISWGKMPAGGIRRPAPQQQLQASSTSFSSAPQHQPASAPVAPLFLLAPGPDLRERAAALVAAVAARADLREPVRDTMGGPSSAAALAACPPPTDPAGAQAPAAVAPRSPPATSLVGGAAQRAVAVGRSAHSPAGAPAAADSAPGPIPAAATAAASAAPHEEEAAEAAGSGAATAAPSTGPPLQEGSGSGSSGGAEDDHPRRRPRAFQSGWGVRERGTGPQGGARGDSLSRSLAATFDQRAPPPGAELLRVCPPTDPLRRAVIDLCSEYVSKDGQGLEGLLQARAHSEELLGPGGEEGGGGLFDWLAHDAEGGDALYYRWRVYALLQQGGGGGGGLVTWRSLPFQMQAGGAWFLPPPCPPDSDVTSPEEEEAQLRAQLQAAAHREAGGRGAGSPRSRSRDRRETRTADHRQPPRPTAAPPAPGPPAGGRSLREEDEAELRRLLAGPHLGRAFVRSGMVFALEHADAARQVVGLLAACFSEAGAAPAVALLYLVSDILHNSSAPVRNASVYRSELQLVLPACFEALGACLRRLGGRMTSRAMQERVLRVLAFWERISVLAPLFIAGLESTLMRRAAVVEDAPGQGAEEAPIGGLTVEEVLRKARTAGLSVAGGARAAVQRLAWLAEYTRLKAGIAALPAAAGPSSVDQQQQQRKPVTLMSLITAKGEGAPAPQPSSSSSSAWAELAPDYSTSSDGGGGGSPGVEGEEDINGVPLDDGLLNDAPPLGAAAGRGGGDEADDDNDEDVDGVPLEDDEDAFQRRCGLPNPLPPLQGEPERGGDDRTGQPARGRWDRAEGSGVDVSVIAEEEQPLEAGGGGGRGRGSDRGGEGPDAKRGRWG